MLVAVGAVITPLASIENCELAPTENKPAGAAVPTPTRPPFGFNARDLFNDVVIVPSPFKLKALPALEPEMEAVGVPELTFKKANLAEVLACPPTKRSSVEFSGKMAPLPLVHTLEELPPAEQFCQVGVEAPALTKH